MGIWIVRKHCGCAQIAIADGAIYQDATLAKVLALIITQSARNITHQATEDPVVVFTQCPHDVQQLELEGIRRDELRTRGTTAYATCEAQAAHAREVAADTALANLAALAASITSEPPHTMTVTNMATGERAML